MKIIAKRLNIVQIITQLLLAVLFIVTPMLILKQIKSQSAKAIHYTDGSGDFEDFEVCKWFCSEPCSERSGNLKWYCAVLQYMRTLSHDFKQDELQNLQEYIDNGVIKEKVITIQLAIILLGVVLIQAMLFTQICFRGNILRTRQDNLLKL